MNPSEQTLPSTPDPVPAQRRGIRGWIPLVILALAVANIARVQMAADMASNFRTMQTVLTVPITVLLLLIWFLFLSRLRWRTRLIGFAVLVLGVFGLTRLIRFDGTVDGTGRPNIVWKWTPRREGYTGAFKTAPATTNAAPLKGEADFAGYLGADRQGVIANAPLERNWAEHPPQQLWRQPIGLGWSAFAVTGSHAVTQEQRGESELVVCYELANGSVAWAHTNAVRFSETMGGDGPRATPTVTEGRVYALGATGILDCLEAATGKTVWSRDTLKEQNLPNLPFGKSTSPLVTDKLVVVTGGMTNGPTLLAYHRTDGSPAWQGGTDKASYSSPMAATLGGQRQIVSINAGTVTGHDLADGRVLWEYKWASDKWPKCAQPVLLSDDRIFLSASFDAGCVLVQVKQAAGKFAVTELWKGHNLKSELSNVVQREGYVYGLDDGILTCVELATGTRKWKDGRYGHGQILLAGDTLLVQTEQGPVVLVEANPVEYREIARLSALSSKTWNVPALAGEYLLVRNDQEAACYKLPVKGK